MSPSCRLHVGDSRWIADVTAPSFQTLDQKFPEFSDQQPDRMAKTREGRAQASACAGPAKFTHAPSHMPSLGPSFTEARRVRRTDNRSIESMRQGDGSFERMLTGTETGSGLEANRDLHCSVLLAEAGRLLLEYNESTATIHRVLTETSEALTGTPCSIEVTYGSVTVSTAGESPVLRSVSELRYNTALLVRVREILGAVRGREVDVPKALDHLRRLEQEVPPYTAWIAVPVLGIAAASLARLLGADVGGLLVAGVATAVGLAVRKRLGRRGHGPLTLALVAALIGAVLGGLAFRFGWTRMPDVTLVVPALMVVPGPHLINGLLDLVDNFVPMSVARLWLAAAILLASTVGLAVGIEFTLPDSLAVEVSGPSRRPPFLFAVILAGLVTCGFAVFYNVPWRQVGLAAVAGMAGNALRDRVLDFDVRLDAATLLGGFAVGLVAAGMARSLRTPVAIVAFAGAVTMMPGTLMYQTLGGVLRLARVSREVDAAAAAALVASFGQVCLIVSGLAFGLILGARGVQAVTRARSFQTGTIVKTPPADAR